MVVDAIAQANLDKDFRWLELDGKFIAKPVPLRDLPQLAATWKTPRTAALFPTKDVTLACQLELRLLKHYLHFAMRLSDDWFESNRKTLVEESIRFATAIAGALPDDVLLGPTVGAVLFRLPYPTLRPRRVISPFGAGGIVDFVSQGYVERETDPIALDVVQAMKRLLKAKVPRCVKRENIGGLAVFRWVEDLEDLDEVASRMSLREQWLDQNLELERFDDFNEQGDQKVEFWNIQKLAEGAFHHPGEKWAFKAIPAIRGKLDKAILDEIVGWKKSGQIKKGKPVSHVGIVVQSRDAARAVAKPAKLVGIDRVVYADDEGTWWDPDPPGLWVEKPDPRLDDLVPPPKYPAK